MPQFSAKSMKNLRSCHPKLQRLFLEVIKDYDCTILEGHRSEERQMQLFKEGKSKLYFPKSKHNIVPSHAVDVVPYPVDWSEDPKNIARFYHFIGYVFGVASKLGIKIRSGADWDNDLARNGQIDFKDQTFDDLPHFELD